MRAQRRLAQTEPASRPRDVALGQERVERDQEVEIDFLAIHEIDSNTKQRRFQWPGAALYLQRIDIGDIDIGDLEEIPR